MKRRQSLVHSFSVKGIYVLSDRMIFCKDGHAFVQLGVLMVLDE